MSTSLKILTVSALLAASMAQFSGVARAAPIGEPLAIARTIPSTIEPVYWRGGGWGWGAPLAGGLIAGAIIGGALSAPYYAPGYYPGPTYYNGPPPGDAIGYCMQRFKSYDPASGTYLGYDGYRHPCP
jgi:hypothetical protein